MPPVAMRRGPGDVPLGENGCCASSTRSLPSAPVYRCGRATDGSATSARRQSGTSELMESVRVRPDTRVDFPGEGRVRRSNDLATLDGLTATFVHRVSDARCAMDAGQKVIDRG